MLAHTDSSRELIRATRMTRCSSRNLARDLGQHAKTTKPPLIHSTTTSTAVFEDFVHQSNFSITNTEDAFHKPFACLLECSPELREKLFKTVKCTPTTPTSTKPSLSDRMHTMLRFKHGIVPKSNSHSFVPPEDSEVNSVEYTIALWNYEHPDYQIPIPDEQKKGVIRRVKEIKEVKPMIPREKSISPIRLAQQRVNKYYRRLEREREAAKNSRRQRDDSSDSD